MNQTVTSTQKQLDSIKKEVNDLRKKTQKQKVELKTKTDDLDETKFDLRNKEILLKDVKETLNR